jgi:transposase
MRPWMPSRHHRDLTDAQRAILDTLIPEPTPRRDGRGRPWKDRRAVLNGILWVLRTGAPWADVPDRYPSYQTCHRRFQQWVRSGVMKGILEALALDLKARGALDVTEANGCGRPPWSSSRRMRRKRYPHDVKLATSTLFQMVIPDAPQSLIGDNAYDSDKLDTKLST